MSLIGYTRVERQKIEDALVGFNDWQRTWWDKLQSYRAQRIKEYDNRLISKVLQAFGYNPSDDAKVNSFGGSYFKFEYYAVQELVPQSERSEFYEYYTSKLKSTATRLRALLKVGNEDPLVSSKGCKFIRRFGGL